MCTVLVCVVRQWMGPIWWALTSMPEAWDSWVGQSLPTQHRQGIDFSHWGKQHIPRVRGDTWKNNPPPLISKHMERMHSFSSFSFTAHRHIQDRRSASSGLRGSARGQRHRGQRHHWKRAPLSKTWEVKGQVLPKFPRNGEQTNWINRAGHWQGCERTVGESFIVRKILCVMERGTGSEVLLADNYCLK